jgi:hypothetical protein
VGPPRQRAQKKNTCLVQFAITRSRWNWDRNITGFAAGVSVSSFTCTDADLQAIDAKLDDGDLSTGNFQKVSSNRAMYILEP